MNEKKIRSLIILSRDLCHTEDQESCFRLLYQSISSKAEFNFFFSNLNRFLDGYILDDIQESAVIEFGNKLLR